MFQPGTYFVTFECNKCEFLPSNQSQQHPVARRNYKYKFILYKHLGDIITQQRRNCNIRSYTHKRSCIPQRRPLPILFFIGKVTFGGNEIWYYAFSGCTSLKEIHLKSTSGTSFQNNSFGGVDKSSCIVYVPVGSLNNYINWAGFSDIREEGQPGLSYRRNIQSLTNCKM